MLEVPIMIDHDFEKNVIGTIQLTEEGLDMIMDRLDKFIILGAGYRKDGIIGNELIEISLLTEKTDKIDEYLNNNWKNTDD